MKKIVSLVLVLMLCMSVVALAESAPSPKPGVTTTVTVENGPADPSFAIIVLAENATDEQKETYADLIKQAEEQIEVLKAADPIETYFGEVKDFEGNPVDLKAMVNADPINVNEFYGIVAVNYDEAYGKVTVDFQFPTLYEKDETVAVLLGKINVNIDDTVSVEWTAFEGKVIDDQGTVEVVLEPETVTGLMEGGLIAIASK